MKFPNLMRCEFTLVNVYMRRSRNFCQGRSRSIRQKKALTTFYFFFLFFFLVLSLFYKSQRVNLKDIYHFSRIQGGSHFFSGGSNCLFPIETHITCDFPGGGGGGSGPPVPPPLDPHLVYVDLVVFTRIAGTS